MNIRKIISLIGFLCLVLALAGCAGTEGGLVSEKGLQAAQTADTGKTTGTADIAETIEGAANTQSFKEEDLLKLQSSLTEIVTAGDVSKCTELTVEQYFVTCEINILSATAKSAADTQVCDKASNEYIKGRCVAQVKLKTS